MVHPAAQGPKTTMPIIGDRGDAATRSARNPEKGERFSLPLKEDSGDGGWGESHPSNVTGMEIGGGGIRPFQGGEMSW